MSSQTPLDPKRSKRKNPPAETTEVSKKNKEENSRPALQTNQSSSSFSFLDYTTLQQEFEATVHFYFSNSRDKGLCIRKATADFYNKYVKPGILSNQILLDIVFGSPSAKENPLLALYELMHPTYKIEDSMFMQAIKEVSLPLTQENINKARFAFQGNIQKNIPKNIQIQNKRGGRPRSKKAKDSSPPLRTNPQSISSSSSSSSNSMFSFFNPLNPSSQSELESVQSLLALSNSQQSTSSSSSSNLTYSRLQQNFISSIGSITHLSMINVLIRTKNVIYPFYLQQKEQNIPCQTIVNILFDNDLVRSDTRLQTAVLWEIVHPVYEATNDHIMTAVENAGLPITQMHITAARDAFLAVLKRSVSGSLFSQQTQANYFILKYEEMIKKSADQQEQPTTTSTLSNNT